MARISRSTGSCPTCARDVPRTVSFHHGLAVESYHCPQHGRREYTPHSTVAEWAAAPKMVDLRGMMEWSAPQFGVPWVA